jgi:hypothetical protein
MPLSCPSPVAEAGTCSARAGAAEAAVPVPAAMASDMAAATVAASAANSPRLDAGTRLKIRRFTFWSSSLSWYLPFRQGRIRTLA